MGLIDVQNRDLATHFNQHQQKVDYENHLTPFIFVVCHRMAYYKLFSSLI